MNCPHCGAEYHAIYQLGDIAPVTHVQTCMCPSTYSNGGASNVQITYGNVTTPAQANITTVRCAWCDDVVPVFLAARANDVNLCPTCFDAITEPAKPLTPVEDLVDDLQALIEELRPG